MAQQRYNKYQYETSPRKLNPSYEPQRRKKTQIPKKTTVRKKENSTRTNVKMDASKKAKTILYIIIGFIVLFTISYRNSLINEKFSKVKMLKEELSSVQKENEQLQVSIENSLNLNNIEKSAKSLLGMQKLTNDQKVYISLPKKDYVESASEEVVIKSDKNVFQKVIELITGNE